MKTPIFALVGLFLVSSLPAQTILAGWNFNNATSGSGFGSFNTTGSAEVYDSESNSLSVASHGVYADTAKIDFSGLSGANGGSSSNNWGTQAGDYGNAVDFDDAGTAFSIAGTENNLKSLVFTFSTQGFADVSLSYAARGTSSGYKTQTWEWSADGSTWNVWEEITDLSTTFQVFTLSEISGLNDLEVAYARVTFDGATTGFNPYPPPGSTTDNGNNRLDNLVITGVPVAVPETKTAFLLAVGGIWVLGSVRRRRN